MFQGLEADQVTSMFSFVGRYNQVPPTIGLFLGLGLVFGHLHYPVILGTMQTWGGLCRYWTRLLSVYRAGLSTAARARNYFNMKKKNWKKKKPGLFSSLRYLEDYWCCVRPEQSRRVPCTNSRVLCRPCRDLWNIPFGSAQVGLFVGQLMPGL